MAEPGSQGKTEEENATAAVCAPKPAMRGAIGMADGKAKLLRDDYCDGLLQQISGQAALGYQRNQQAQHNNRPNAGMPPFAASPIQQLLQQE